MQKYQHLKRSQDYGELLFAQATALPAHTLALPFARRAGLRSRLQRLLTTSQSPRWLISARWLTALTLLAIGGVLIASIRSTPFRLEKNTALQEEAFIRLDANPFPASP
jgi:hypothetical protein